MMIYKSMKYRKKRNKEWGEIIQKWLRISLVIAIIILILLWLLNQFEIYQQNILIIQEHMNTTQAQMNSIQQQLQHTHTVQQQLIVKINGVVQDVHQHSSELEHITQQLKKEIAEVPIQDIERKVVTMEDLQREIEPQLVKQPEEVTIKPEAIITGGTLVTMGALAIEFVRRFLLPIPF